MFTRMDQSTQEEWQHISEEHMPHIFDMPKRIISMLKQAEELTLGFNTDQLIFRLHLGHLRQNDRPVR